MKTGIHLRSIASHALFPGMHSDVADAHHHIAWRSMLDANNDEEPYLRAPGAGPNRFLPTAMSSIHTVKPSSVAG